MRRAGIELTYQNRDITRFITPHLTSFTFTDNDEGKVDDLSISLEDSRDLWKADWFPGKGDVLIASISTDYDGNQRSIRLGVFTIDDITLQGPPDTVTIKAVSSLINTSIRREQKTRSWESVTFLVIAKQIADEHGFDLYFDNPDNLVHQRVDQKQESDLSFLNRLAIDNGSQLKVKDQLIIIYSPIESGDKEVSLRIDRFGSEIIRYSLKTKAHDIYSSCEVRYFDPVKKEELVYTYTPENPPPVNQVLKVNKRVESLAQAERIAKFYLFRANRNEVTGSLEISGRLDLFAGMNSQWDGFGRLSGKYAHETVTHKMDATTGFTTSLKARRISA